MNRPLFFVLALGSLLLFSCTASSEDSKNTPLARAQQDVIPTSTTEKPVLTGTYSFEKNERTGSLKISQLDREVLQFELEVVGAAPAYNQGRLAGEAYLTASQDSAGYATEEYGAVCELLFEFNADGVAVTTVRGTSSDCGFGNRVNADGFFERISDLDPFVPMKLQQSLFLDGKWQSTDDRAHQIELSDGRYISYYNGKAIDTLTYEYYADCPEQCASLEGSCLLLKSTFDATCYYISVLEKERFHINLIGGPGNSVEYHRVE